VQLSGGFGFGWISESTISNFRIWIRYGVYEKILDPIRLQNFYIRIPLQNICKPEVIADPVSSEIFDLRNFWLHTTCACTEQYFAYEICWEKWWLGLKVYCWGKCVWLGFMLELEKEIDWGSQQSQIFFSGYTYFRAIACVAVTLARPLHVSKVGRSMEKGKTKQATLLSDFHAHGSKSSLWPIRLARN